MPSMGCPACGRSAYECLCRETCALCGIRTNHDTKAHEDAARMQCVDCGEYLATEDPEARLCPACMEAA